jgi:hypothetical protein
MHLQRVLNFRVTFNNVIIKEDNMTNGESLCWHLVDSGVCLVLLQMD